MSGVLAGLSVTSGYWRVCQNRIVPSRNPTAAPTKQILALRVKSQNGLSEKINLYYLVLLPNRVALPNEPASLKT